MLGGPRRGARGGQQLIRLTHPRIALDATLEGREFAVDVPDVLGGPLGDLPEVEHPYPMELALQNLRHTLDLRQIVRLAVPGVLRDGGAGLRSLRRRGLMSAVRGGGLRTPGIAPVDGPGRVSTGTGAR